MISEKFWTEDGNRRINNSSTSPESTNKTISGSYKNVLNLISESRNKQSSIDQLVSICTIILSTEYKERQDKHVMNFMRKYLNTIEYWVVKNGISIN